MAVGGRMGGEVIDWEYVLVMRMSDWKCERMPLACATAGMSNVLAGGLPSFGTGEMGVTRLIDTGTVLLETAVGPIFPEAFWVRATVSVAWVEPTSRLAVSTVAVRLRPDGGSVPVAGVTLMKGLSEVMM